MPGLNPHLIQAALNDDNQGEGNCVQAEEDIITVHRVHTIGIFEEKLLLLRVGRSWEVRGRQPASSLGGLWGAGSIVP